MVRSVLVLILMAGVAAGQNYNFSIPEFSCTAEVNRDRSIIIRYDILFETTPGYSPIDIVDIGFTSNNFTIGETEATLDRVPLDRIYYSTYITNGVEIHLGDHAIQPGNRGRLRVTGLNREMVFLDTEEDDYASVRFSPTWFDGGMLKGASDFSLTLVFPEGAEPDLVRYHDVPFTSSGVGDDGRVFYVWEESRKVDSPYMVGISFPEHLVDGPLAERPKPPPVSLDTIIFLVFMAVFFLIFGLMIFAIVSSLRKASRRREEYLPPRLGLEGTGVKRGLTAPMAALLLEAKLDRVMMLIVFGLLKKGKLQLDGHRLKRTGSDQGLRSYEKEILKLIPTGGRTEPIPGDEVMKVFTGMIKELEEKMKDYSLKETREYYRSIIDTAWRMLDNDISAEKAGEILGDRFQWLLADGRFDKRVNRLPDTRSAVLPAFMYGYFTGTATPSSGTAGGISIARACSQVAGSLKSAAGSAVSSITSLTRTVTSRTNPVPVSTTRSSSGSGCACACACAGCACACAGGGR